MEYVANATSATSTTSQPPATLHHSSNSYKPVIIATLRPLVSRQSFTAHVTLLVENIWIRENASMVLPAFDLTNGNVADKWRDWYLLTLPKHLNRLEKLHQNQDITGRSTFS